MQWLSDPRTGGFYLVELFENPVVAQRRTDEIGGELTSSLERMVASLGTGVVAWRLPEAGGETPFALRITDGTQPALLSASRPASKEVATVDQDAVRHEDALQRLAQHPSVRSISLPLRFELSEVSGTPAPATSTFPGKSPGVQYPKVGVVDSGLGPALAPWVIERHDFLSTADVDGVHGSFVGGLIVGANSLNPSLDGLEADGCNLIDLALFPKGNFLDTYKNGFADFLDEMDQAIGEASKQHGIRVINLSINAVSAVEPDQYSYYAARVDQIAKKHNAIIVYSAGNLPHSACRAPWPKRPTEAIDYFAARVEPDTIYVPTESHRAISVGAINPPGCSVHHDGLPTTYTRRGPGLRVGCKPDVAHFGGNDGAPDGNHRLISISPKGKLLTSCGTSFAAPLVAKSLASLENSIEGDVASDTLRALLVHNSETPVPLQAKGLATLARQFVGFGVPRATTEMLVTDDSAITLVFESRISDDLKRPKVLRFDFDWPQSLVDPTTGACLGEASATVVYEPPVDRAYGAEFVRVNLDAKLMQRQFPDRKDGSPSYRDQLEQCFLPKTSNQPALERPTKRYRTRIPKAGVGASSQWRIEVSAVTRAEATFPKEGVPFTLIVTIRDPEGVQPIFHQLRRTLQAGRVQLSELRTYQRIRASG